MPFKTPLSWRAVCKLPIRGSERCCSETRQAGITSGYVSPRMPSPTRRTRLGRPNHSPGEFCVDLLDGEGVKEYDADPYSVLEISRLWEAIKKSIDVVNDARKKAATGCFVIFPSAE